MSRRIVVRGEPGDRVAELLDALRPFATGPSPAIDGRPVGLDTVLGEVPLLEGSTISFGPVLPPPRQRRHDVAVLRVVGGRGAGRIVALTPGQHRVGRLGQASDIVLEDPEVSSRHLAVTVEPSGAIRVQDLASANGTFLEGRRLGAETAEVGPDEVLQVGGTLLSIGPAAVEPLEVLPAGDRLELNRRFRAAGPSFEQRVSQPPAPPSSKKPGLNLALTIAPAVLIGVVSVLAGRPEFALFALMSPLLGVGRTIQQRRSWEAERKRAESEHTAALAGAAGRLSAAVWGEHLAKRHASPDLALLTLQASTPGRRLWERGPSDPDFLELRIGTAPWPSTVQVEPKPEIPPRLWAVPVTVDLVRHGSLSLLGPPDLLQPVAAGLVLQLALRESPSNLRIVVVTDKAGQPRWDWVTWLPHCRWASDDPFALVGSDQTSTQSRLGELRTLIKKRREAMVGTGRDELPLPAVVVVLDGAARLLRAGFTDILRDGPAVAVHAICLDPAQVPEQCRAAVSFVDGSTTDLALDRQGMPRVEPILADLAQRATCEQVALALAPLRPLGDAAETELPTNLRLLDLVDLEKPTPEAVLARWRLISPSPAATIGVGADGPVSLDLTRQGPHGLVAGTTRSGKSEFVKTLSAAFAVDNHPDDLQILFIDFKGGGDYQLLKRLPHAVDLATSEDLEDFVRTVTLLDAEITRRRRAITAAQATTIEGYQTARQSRPDLPPIGRLLVVADEFARLVADAPEQLDKLVKVAQTGAAFGVHLLLATQRPGGAVTGQIDANVSLRVCYRTRKGESVDVIGTDDADGIAERHRGRAFYRAHTDPLREVQTARVGGARPGSSRDRTALTAWLRPWHEEGHIPKAEAPVEVPDPETDLADVVEAVLGAARLSGWRECAVPWPRPLPELVDLPDLPPPLSPDLVPVAVVDDPGSQRRRATGLAFGTGHLGVGGSARSGRTTTLRTLAASTAVQRSAADTHIYVLDFAGGGLRPVVGLPHCGGSAFDEDWEQATRLVASLGAEVQRRQDLLSEHSYADITEQRSSGGEPLPFLLLLVDGWEVIAEEGQRYGLVDALAQLLAKGPAAGLSAVVAGDRTIGQGRIGRAIGTKWALRFNDPGDYATMGIGFRETPSSPLPPGRFIVSGTGEIGQVALVADPAGEGQATALRRLVEQVRARDEHLRAGWPRRVEPLPRSISHAELVARRPPPSVELPLLLGLSASSSLPAWIDLAAAGGSAFVAGPGGSGRTTALRSMATALLDAGVTVALASSRSSALLQLADHAGVVASLAGPTARQMDPGDLGGARVLLVDDAELLDPAHPGHLAIANGSAGIALLLSASTDALGSPSGWTAAAKRTRTGLLLCPKTKFDGALFGAALPEAMVFSAPRGRAVAGAGGGLEIVQVALA